MDKLESKKESSQIEKEYAALMKGVSENVFSKSSLFHSNGNFVQLSAYSEQAVGGAVTAKSYINSLKRQ